MIHDIKNLSNYIVVVYHIHRTAGKYSSKSVLRRSKGSCVPMFWKPHRSTCGAKMLWLRWGTLPGLSSLWPNSIIKCPKHLGSALQSKSTLNMHSGAMSRMGMFQELLRRQPLQARLYTHSTTINSYPVYKLYRETTCQAGHVENKDLSSWKSHGTVSSLWTELGGRNLVWNLHTWLWIPATHMDLPISPVLSQSSPS